MLVNFFLFENHCFMLFLLKKMKKNFFYKYILHIFAL